MAGGEWSPTDMPVLPGAYMNFKAMALAAIQPGSRGILAMPVRASWGPAEEFVEVTSEAELIAAFGNDITTSGVNAYKLGKLALLGQPQKLKLYRLIDGDKAKQSITLKDDAAVDVLTLETKYYTTRAFKVVVATNPVDDTKQDIKLYENTRLLYTFTFTAGDGGVDNAVAAVNDDSGNLWVEAIKVAAGSGTLAVLGSTAMTGGNDGISGITGTEYTKIQTACETEKFHALALDGISDSGIQTSMKTWVSRVRSEGKGIILVMGGAGADDKGAGAVSTAVGRSSGWSHEGVVNVGNGAYLNGIEYSSAEIACYIAALMVGQRLSESLCYSPTFFSDVTRRWTRSEMESGVEGGVLLLYHDGNMVKVLMDVNTLTTLGQDQSEAWKVIRTIRIFDQINDDFMTTAESQWIGRIVNDEDGRKSVAGMLKDNYLATLALARVIEKTGYDVYEDPDYHGEGASGSPLPYQAFFKWTATVTDVMKQIFGTFWVQ